MNAPRSPIDEARLWSDLMSLAEVTDPNRPYTRRSFSPLFIEGRSWLRRRFEEAGLQVRIDAGGNLIGRREGRDPDRGVIMIGSHSDTVPGGGRFDGAAGVVAALEVARSLAEHGHDMRHALEVVDFLAEEPSEYGLSCVGSRAIAGSLDRSHLGKLNATGESLGAAIDRIGGSTDNLGLAKRSDIDAYFELHIEQGPVLEEREVDLGVVTGIVRIARVEIEFEGAAGHAGTVPMASRRDAAGAAARTVIFVEERALAAATASNSHFVATAGVIDIQPGAANVIPSRARLVIDIRAEDDARLDGFIAALDAETSRIADARKLKRSRYDVVSDSEAARCDPRLQQLLREGASRHGLTTIPMSSGAGHDAAFVARVAPMAMLFVPCRGGQSHVPDEWTEPAALAAGAKVLFEAVRLFDDGTHGNDK